MITVDQFRDNVIAYIRTWWPGSKVWEDPTHSGRLFREFEPFQLADIQAALEDIRAEGGQNAPAPGKLIARVEQVTIIRRGSLPGADNVNWVQVCQEQGHHMWAVLDEVADTDRDTADGLKLLRQRAEELADSPIGSRLAQCARCLMKTVFGPGKLLTAAELDERPDVAADIAVR